ncbi:DUF788-domain-containing protein [Piromyces finnis]|uniref:DUF788-domain-containing protein n=1 Tax=Piromyces finnis TaxID=1754191 RepID=A0A1Y1VBW4_9FUNG|nr:DUF788-domain-containing protein [Piromyces finnis]|eukprot:ORX52151.1 DUF788-domain-containing protein [Piromyces finnis]
MANQSDKRISAYNKEVLKKQWMLTIVVAVFYLLIRLTFRRDTIKAKFIYGFIAMQVTTVILILLMKKMAFVKGANPSVQYAGVNFNDNGNVVSYLFDIVFIFRFVTFTTAFSDFYWWFLIVIPLYAVYKIIASVILPILRASTSQNPSPEQVLSKTQQKKQARRENVKYK